MVVSVTRPRSPTPAAHPEVSEDVFAAAERHGIEEVHVFTDPTVGLKGVVAIHSTALGPALGGTRCLTYPTFAAALRDACLLARGMSYKAAIHGLPLGGGKAVLIAPPVIPDRKRYFEAWAGCVEKLGGRFITAEDSGTSVADMDVMAGRTRYVVGTSALGDPSPCTARGVRRAIEAVLAFRTGSRSYFGAHVAIQGVGNVGYELARQLAQGGAKLTVTDRDHERAARCARELVARVVSPDAIYDVRADVFAPCALGGSVNAATLERLEVGAIAGSANNQLDTLECAELARMRGILYAPDYVVNGGGLMRAALPDGPQLVRRIDEIYDLLGEVFHAAAAENVSPLTVANQRAERILNGHKS